jgi:hypothetical protein
MYLLLKFTEVFYQLFEDLNTALNLQVVYSLGTLEGTPHYSFELVPQIKEFDGLIVYIRV